MVLRKKMLRAKSTITWGFLRPQVNKTWNPSTHMICDKVIAHTIINRLDSKVTEALFTFQRQGTAVQIK